jgi:hypothetical protein
MPSQGDVSDVDVAVIGAGPAGDDGGRARRDHGLLRGDTGQAMIHNEAIVEDVVRTPTATGSPPEATVTRQPE